MGNGSAVGDVFKGGRYVGSLDLTKLWSLSRIRIAFDVFQPPLELDKHPESEGSYYDHPGGPRHRRVSRGMTTISSRFTQGRLFVRLGFT